MIKARDGKYHHLWRHARLHAAAGHKTLMQTWKYDERVRGGSPPAFFRPLWEIYHIYIYIYIYIYIHIFLQNICLCRMRKRKGQSNTLFRYNLNSDLCIRLPFLFFAWALEVIFRDSDVSSKILTKCQQNINRVQTKYQQQCSSRPDQRRARPGQPVCR